MTVDLASPYRPQPSRPRVEGVTFYSPSREDLLFSKNNPPDLVCVSYLRALKLEWTLSHNRVQEPLCQGPAAPRYDNSFSIHLPFEKLAFYH